MGRLRSFVLLPRYSNSFLLKAIDGKLSNKNFLERAPESVVEKERSNLKKLNEELEKITVNLEVLK